MCVHVCVEKCLGKCWPNINSVYLWVVGFWMVFIFSWWLIIIVFQPCTISIINKNCFYNLRKKSILFLKKIMFLRGFGEYFGSDFKGREEIFLRPKWSQGSHKSVVSRMPTKPGARTAGSSHLPFFKVLLLNLENLSFFFHCPFVLTEVFLSLIIPPGKEEIDHL